MGRSDSTAGTGSFELMLEEHVAPSRAGGGYDPYQTWPSVRQPGSSSKQADLRRLSEWIRLRRQVSQLKKPED